MKVLVINCGSSSLKYQLIDMSNESVICKGNCERIGIDGSFITHKANGGEWKVETSFPTHVEAFTKVVEMMTEGEGAVIKDKSEISAIGHRIVQGAEKFSEPCLVTDEVIQAIDDLSALAPAHNKAHAMGLRSAKAVFGENVPNVVVFDTAFHATMPPKAYMYAVPYEFYEKYDLRRYGAHGTSHRYLAERASAMLSKEKLNLITCHLGSGSSITAIKDGRSIATSMGLTPLGGIMMGTRSGDIDPSVYYYIQKVTGKTNDEVFRLLNKESGLKGVSGVSSDSRDILKAMDEGDERAKLTMDLFARRTLDFIGQYFVRLGHVDMIIFSAGIGENDPYIRKVVCDALKPSLGIEIDDELNANARGKEIIISKPSSKIKVAVIPTDEEIMIARDTYKIYLGEKL